MTGQEAVQWSCNARGEASIKGFIRGDGVASQGRAVRLSGGRCKP
jgi:hypothetical protein